MAFPRVSSFALIYLMIVIVIPAAVCDYQPISVSLPRIILPLQPEPPEVYTLAIQWGKTVCRQKCFCSSVPQYFSIHGLWPDRYKDCTGSPFDPRLISLNQNLMKDLKAYWMDAEKNDNMAFWKYQYNHHGVCANTQVFSFFRMALSVYSKIRPMQLSIDALSEFRGAAEANKTVTPQMIYFRLKEALGKDFVMVCVNDNGIYKLKELRLLFHFYNRQWILIDNPRPLHMWEICPDARGITLPLQ